MRDYGASSLLSPLRIHLPHTYLRHSLRGGTEPQTWTEAADPPLPETPTNPPTAVVITTPWCSQTWRGKLWIQKITSGFGGGDPATCPASSPPATRSPLFESRVHGRMGENDSEAEIDSLSTFLTPPRTVSRSLCNGYAFFSFVLFLLLL